MGMYSYFKDDDLEVKNLVGLNVFLKRWGKSFPDWKYMANLIQEADGKEKVTFREWDNIKLISYWYDETCLFLKCVAKYLEGYVYWDFENNDEGGYVEFEEGKCIIHTGQMNWSSCSPDSITEMNWREDRRETEKKQKIKDFLLMEAI